MSATLPVFFFGHGNPLTTLSDNSFTRAWSACGQTLPRPRAVLVISAHWYPPCTAVTSEQQPETIHDFSGFPRELQAITYPAPGSPELAARVAELLAPVPVQATNDWGLDHGCWTVLRHLFPRADIPVVQLSIDRTQPPAWHFAQGQRLQVLRDEGVLILGSGSLVHNLRLYVWDSPTLPPYDWALRFEGRIRQALEEGDAETLIQYQQLGDDARLAAPTPEHYLPLVYIAGLRRAGDAVSYPVTGIDGGAVSMLAVRFG